MSDNDTSNKLSEKLPAYRGPLLRYGSGRGFPSGWPVASHPGHEQPPKTTGSNANKNKS